tara:strand:- start:7216 stop:7737 length:522 start_codon:yes stop_codon:yes gene_type:complete
MKTLCTLYGRLIKLSNVTLSPLLDVAIRLYMANIFFKSGMLKYDNYTTGNWDETVLLFEEIHPIPGIDPHFAAVTGTAAELILPVLLAIGLFTRFGAAGLLVMTLVIQFVVPESYEISNPEHYYWMLLLAVPMLKGGGLFSLDFLAQKFWCGKKTTKTNDISHNSASQAEKEA